jgi:uncharacterized protein YggE
VRHLFLVSLIALTSISVLADTPVDRTISVSGEAVVMVAPDQAVVTLGVQTFHQNLETASLTNDSAAKKLLAEWKRLGIPDANIQTTGVTVDISYLTNNERARTIEGYVVSRSYDVIADSAATAEKVIARGLASGANSVGEVGFRTTEMRRYRDQARVSALKTAREKAELMASQLGASVGPPRSITESSGYDSPRRYNRNAMSQNVMTVASDSGDADTEGAVAPGQIAVRASVAVVFDLIPRQ